MELERILRTEGTPSGGRLGEATNNAPSIGNVLLSRSFVTGGTFNQWIKQLYITTSIDCEVLLNIRLANGFLNASNQDLKGVTNLYLDLKAGVMQTLNLDTMLLYNQVIQFLFISYKNGSSGPITITVSYSSYELFMNRNIYAPKAIKILGDSISAGANSSTTNAKPYGSWFSQVVFNHYGATKDVKGINKAVGGVTAEGMDRASITGWSYCDNADVVLVALGTNPDSSDTVFTNSIESILNREKVYHPNAWFIVCAPIVKDNSGEAQMVVYRTILQNIVASRSDPKTLYLPFENLGILPGVIPSDVHPNQAGHDSMYNYAKQFLITNNVTI
jgi:lysophospholipase L1-like esterase